MKMPLNKGRSIIYILFFISLFSAIALTSLYFIQLKKYTALQQAMPKNAAQKEDEAKHLTTQLAESSQKIITQIEGFVVEVNKEKEVITYKEVKNGAQDIVEVDEQTKLYTTFSSEDKTQMPQRKEINIDNIKKGDIITINTNRNRPHYKKIIYIENVN